MSSSFGFMDSFVSWALSILAVVVIGTVLDIFLSEKKLGKAVRGVFASLAVLIIISPVPSIITGCKNFDMDSFSQEITLDQNYLNYAEAQKKRALDEGLQAALTDKGYKNVKADITAEFGIDIKISMVKLDLSGLAVAAPASNANKTEKVRELTADFLKVSKDIIVINE